MDDMRKTKARLVEELGELRKRVADLEAGKRDFERNRFEQELHESQSMLQSVLDNASTVIFIKDLEGKYLLINKRYEELFGITKEEIAGKTDFDIFPKEAAEQFQAKDRKALAVDGAIEEEELVPHEDGVHTYISVKFPMYDPQGKPFATCGIATDISERKRAEEALARHHDELEERIRERTLELEQVNRQLHEEIADRELAQAALKESEERYRVLIESSPVSLFVHAGGEVVFANPSANRVLGGGIPDYLLGKKVEEVVHPDSLALARERIEAVYQKQQPGELIEEKFLRADGTAIDVEVVASICDYEGNPASQVVFRDITDRKRAEAALEQSEKKYRSLFENSVVGQFRVAVGGKMLDANRTMAGMFGWDDVESFVDECEMAALWVDPADRARMYAIMKERGELDNFETTFYRKDGTTFPIRVSSKMYPEFAYQEGIVIDVSEEKAALEALKESEERYRTIFYTAGTGMISFGEDSVITLANEEWAKLSGYSVEETVGKLTWMPFFTEESLTKMKKYHQMRSRDPSSVPRAYEAQFRDREGRIHEGIINIQVVPGTQQRVASFQDMTALRRAEKEMFRADKMAALGQIIAGVAHEINNPNNFIYFNLPILRKYVEAMAPLLAQGLEQDSDLKILNMPYALFLEDVFKLLENMEHGSKRITTIVSDLKSYVRSDEELEYKVDQIGAVVDRVMALVGKQVRKMVKRFEVQVADGLPPVRMNAGKIEQVLINLVINAGQAADKEDSRVRLIARRAGEGKDIETRTGEWIEIRIEDNGTGIPAEHLEQIFEPFFTSKSTEAGTGLGLSISQRIVEEHRGTIGVQSTVGQGSVFVIRLPAADRT